MKLIENKFFKPTEIHLKPYPVKIYLHSDPNKPEIIKGVNWAVTKSIVERNNTGAYDEVRVNPEMNDWSSLNFMQWFENDNESAGLPEDKNMSIVKYENEEKQYSSKTDPANVIKGINFDRGFDPEKK